MAGRLQAFRAGEIGIGQLIADLEGLQNALQAAPEDWHKAFREEWWVLEVAYAVALDREAPLPNPSSPQISATLQELERLVTLRRGSSLNE